MSDYMKLIDAWLKGQRDLDRIRQIVSEGHTNEFLHVIRDRATSASDEETESLMELFATILEIKAEDFKNSDSSMENGKDADLQAETTTQVFAISASHSMGPDTANEMLELGKDVLPEKVKRGLANYIARAHNDPEVRGKHEKNKQGTPDAQDEVVRLSNRLKGLPRFGAEAKKVANELVKLVEGSGHIDLCNEVTMVLAEAGFSNMAMQLLEKKISMQDVSNEDSAKLFVGMGNVKLADDPSMAAAFFERALELDSKNIMARIGLAKVHRSAKRWDDALGILRKTLEMAVGKPEEPLVFMELANVLKEMGNLEQAEMFMKRVRSLDPFNEDAVRFYEEYYTYKKDWKNLFGMLQIHLNITKSPKERLILLKRLSKLAFSELHNDDKGFYYLSKVVTLDPKDLDAVTQILEIYEQRGDYEKLMETIEQVLPHIDNEARQSLLLKAAKVSKEKLGSLDKALSFYEQLYELNNELQDVIDNLHELYQKLEKWEEYVAFLEKEKNRVLFVRQKGELLKKIGLIRMEKLNDRAGAKAALRSAYKILPNDEELREVLKAFYTRDVVKKDEKAQDEPEVESYEVHVDESLIKDVETPKEKDPKENNVESGEELIKVEPQKNIEVQDTVQQDDDSALSEQEKEKLFYELFDRGMDLYFAKKYKEALSVWERAKKLNPDHKTLNTNLKMIRRLLDKDDAF